MPVLVRSMKYSELDIILLKGDVEEVGLFKYMCKEEYGGGVVQLGTKGDN